MISVRSAITTRKRGETTMRSNRRSMFVAAALLAGTVLLTACGSDDVDEFDAEAPPTTSSSAATAPATIAPTGDPSAEPGKSSTGGGTTPATSTPNQTGDAPGTSRPEGKDSATGGGGTDGDRTTLEDIDAGKGVNGTWFGNLKYLAPGKYTVSGLKGVEQQFFLANDTEVWGAGEICGDAEGQSATECTEAQLEAATKGVGLTAEVVVENGIATKITEDH